MEVISDNTIMPGDVFTHLTVIALAGHDKSGRRIYRCECKCGNIVEDARADKLKEGRTKSCGCLHAENNARASSEAAARRDVHEEFKTKLQEIGKLVGSKEKELTALQEKIDRAEKAAAELKKADGQEDQSNPSSDFSFQISQWGACTRPPTPLPVDGRIHLLLQINPQVRMVNPLSILRPRRVGDCPQKALFQFQ